VVSLLPWCVLGFFFASALTLNMTGSWQVVITRTRRLLIPYLALGSVYVIMWGVMKASSVDGFLQCIVGDFMCLLTVREPVGEQLYFLPLLFLVSLPWLVIPPGWSRKAVAMIYSGLLFLAALFAIFINGDFNLGTGITINNFIAASLVYCLGVLRENISREINNCSLWTLLIAISATAIAALTNCSLFIWVVMPLAIYQTIVAANLFNRPGFPMNWLTSAGVNSSWIYAYHTPFIIYPTLALVLMFGGGDITAIILAILAALIIPVFIGKLLSRLKWGWVLLG
jgi:hypothetical protein